MTLDNLKEIIEKYFLTNGKVVYQKLNQKFYDSIGLPELENLILSHTSSYDSGISINTRMALIFRGYSTPPNCPVCGTPLKPHMGGPSFNSTCSRKCSRNNPETIQKLASTNIERYGVENPFQSEVHKAKIRKTNKEKYGSENPMGNQDLVNKIADTKKKKYGDPYYRNSEKAALTNMEKYGAATPLESDVIRGKIRDIFQEKFGGPSPYSSSDVRAKKDETVRSQYKNGHFSREHIDNYELLIDKESFVSDFNTIGMTGIKEKYGISNTMFYRFVKNYSLGEEFGSVLEKEVSAFIVGLGFAVENNNRKLIAPYELDIFIPELNIAIECNGAYWHSEVAGKKDKNSHLNKMNLCNQKGIRLVYIWDYEWYSKKNLIMNRLRNVLGINEKYFARKLEIKKVPRDQEKKFLESNHVQGYVGSSHAYGLYLGEELKALATFGKSRFSEVYDFELLRYCSVGNVVGGCSKLFKHFLKNHNPTSVVSYCDLSRNTGNLYSTIGFSKVGISSPNHFYTNDYVNFSSRQKFQKHKLKNILENFDETLTAWENMKNNGYDRIWDCGNAVYVWNKI